MWYPSAGWTTTPLQPALGYHITNSQSRYITPTRLKSAQYSLHNNAPSSRKLLKMDVLTSETCWAANWHNKASVMKLVYVYSNKNPFLAHLTRNLKALHTLEISVFTGRQDTTTQTIWYFFSCYLFLNSLNAELNRICYMLALLGAQHILHVRGLRVNYDYWIISYQRIYCYKT